MAAETDTSALIEACVGSGQVTRLEFVDDNMQIKIDAVEYPNLSDYLDTFHHSPEVQIIRLDQHCLLVDTGGSGAKLVRALVKGGKEQAASLDIEGMVSNYFGPVYELAYLDSDDS